MYKELDELPEKGRTTWKWEDRAPLYKRAIEIIKEDLPIFYVSKPVRGGTKYWWLEK